MAGVHGPQLSDEGRALLDPARQLRWRAPEMALLFSDRAVERAEATGEQGLRLRAEALALFALNRLGRGVAATERALAAVRDAEEAGDEDIAADLRVELACAARQAGGHDAAVRVLGPVLRREQFEAAARVHALVEFAGSAQDGGERTAALDEAERLCGASGIDRDTARILRARASAARAVHCRRVGEFDEAAEVARGGLELLGQLGDQGADSGEFRASLALERVHALLELGQRADAVHTAEPVLHEPVRAASAAPVGWLRFALATRVHLLDGAPGAAVGMLGEAARSAEWFHLDDLLAETLSTLSHVHEENEDTAQALQCLRRAYAADRRWRAAVHAARLRLSEEFPASAAAPQPEGGRRRASARTAEVPASRRSATSHAASELISGEADAAAAAAAPSRAGRRASAAEPAGAAERKPRTSAAEAVAAVEEMAREQAALREQRGRGRGRRRQDESREAAQESPNEQAAPEQTGSEQTVPEKTGPEKAGLEKAGQERTAPEQGAPPTGPDEVGHGGAAREPARGRRARREASRAQEAAARAGTDRFEEQPSQQRHERSATGEDEPSSPEPGRRRESPWGESTGSSTRAAGAASFGAAAARSEQGEPTRFDGQDTNVRDAARRLMDALTGRTGQSDDSGSAASAGDVPEPRVPTGERSRSDSTRHRAASGEESAAAGSPGEPTFSESYRGEAEASAGIGEDDFGIARGATEFPTAPKTFGESAHQHDSAEAEESRFSGSTGFTGAPGLADVAGLSDGSGLADESVEDPGFSERSGLSEELGASGELGRADDSWLWRSSFDLPASSFDLPGEQLSRSSQEGPALPPPSHSASALPEGLVDSGVADTPAPDSGLVPDSGPAADSGVGQSALDEPERFGSSPESSESDLWDRSGAWLDDEEPGDADLDDLFGEWDSERAYGSAGYDRAGSASAGSDWAGGTTYDRPQYDSSWYDSYDADDLGRPEREDPLSAPLGSVLDGDPLGDRNHSEHDRSRRDEPDGDEESRARSGKTLAEIRESLRLLQERSGTAAAARESASQPAAQFIDPDDPLGDQGGLGGGRRHRHAEPPESGGEPASDLLGRYGISEPEVGRAPEPVAEQPAEPAEDAGLADLLAEALVAYESGRREPEQESRSEAAQPRGGRRRGESRGEDEASGTGVSASRHLNQSTSDDPAPRRHRRGAADTTSVQASWTPSAQAQVHRNF